MEKVPSDGPCELEKCSALGKGRAEGGQQSACVPSGQRARTGGRADGVAVLGPVSGPQAGEPPLRGGSAGHSTRWAGPARPPARQQGRDRCTGRSHQQAARRAPGSSRLRAEEGGDRKEPPLLREVEEREAGTHLEAPRRRCGASCGGGRWSQCGGRRRPRGRRLPEWPAVAGPTRQVSGVPGRVAGPAQGRERSAEETRGAGAPRTQRREGVAEAAAPPRGPGARVRG